MKHRSARFLVVLGVALSVACSGRPPDHEEHDDEPASDGRVLLSAEAYEMARIAVDRVAVRVLTPTVRVTGTLSYDERKMAIATARVGGRIDRVVADFGQRVRAGDPLAWIESPELGAAQADYRRALSTSRLREAEYERAKLLVDREAISRGDLLRREADWRASVADRETAEQKLHLLGLSQGDLVALSADDAQSTHVYPVRAPIGGRVTERRAVSGRVVAADDEMFTIAELDSLWLFLQVFEKDLPSVAEGAPVTLTCESHPDDRFRGVVDFVGQVLDPHSRTVTARAVIENAAGDLKPGMFVYATIETRSVSEPPRLAVPVDAVTEMDGERVVFVRIGERAFEPRRIVPGEIAGAWVEVRSGLAEGESIAVSGVFTLKSEVQKSGLAEHDH